MPFRTPIWQLREKRGWGDGSSGRQFQSPGQGMAPASVLLLLLPLLFSSFPHFYSPFSSTFMPNSYPCFGTHCISRLPLPRVITAPSNSPNTFSATVAFIILKSIVFSEIILIPLLARKLPRCWILCWLFAHVTHAKIQGQSLGNSKLSIVPISLELPDFCIILPYRILAGVDLALFR